MFVNVLIKKIGKIPPWLIYFVSPLPGFVESIFSLALPNIGEFFDAPKSIIQFSTVCYYLGFSLGILTLGWISDIIGRRPMILICLISYSIISMILSYSSSIYYFTFFRFFQAYFASVCSVVGQAMIRDSYSKVLLSYMYITMSLSMSLIPSLGYLIGGQIIQNYNWVNALRFVALTIFSFFLICFYFLPETNHFKETKNLAAKSIKEQYSILFAICKDSRFFLHALIVGIFNGLLYGFYMQVPFIFIKGFDMKTSVYGQIILIANSASFIGSLLSKFLIKNTLKIKKVKILGLSLSLLGSALLCIVAINTSHNESILLHIITIFLPFMIHVIGHSILIPLILSTSLKCYSQNLGTAGSIFGSMYYLISAIIVWIISKISKYTIDNYSIFCFTLVLVSIIFFVLGDRIKKIQH